MPDSDEVAASQHGEVFDSKKYSGYSSRQTGQKYGWKTQRTTPGRHKKAETAQKAIDDKETTLQKELKSELKEDLNTNFFMFTSRYHLTIKDITEKKAGSLTQSEKLCWSLSRHFACRLIACQVPWILHSVSQINFTAKIGFTTRTLNPCQVVQGIQGVSGSILTDGTLYKKAIGET